MRVPMPRALRSSSRPSFLVTALPSARKRFCRAPSVAPSAHDEGVVGRDAQISLTPLPLSSPALWRSPERASRSRSAYSAGRPKIAIFLRGWFCDVDFLGWHRALCARIELGGFHELLPAACRRLDRHSGSPVDRLWGGQMIPKSGTFQTRGGPMERERDPLEPGPGGRDPRAARAARLAARQLDPDTGDALHHRAGGADRTVSGGWRRRRGVSFELYRQGSGGARGL